MGIELPDSELIEFAKSIELVSTDVLDGLHRSARGGEGVEYHSTFPYSAGEDARRIDWKRFASSDRFFVNRFEREEKTSWTILIDRSKSMSYEKKLKWASYWAGALIFLAKVWGDRWRLLPDTDSSIEDAFHLLSQNKVGVENPENLEFEGRSGDRLVVFSDFFWDADLLRKRIQKWQSLFDHVSLIQILDPREAEFNFSGVMEFRDLESSDRLVLDAGRAANRYRKVLKKLQESLKAPLSEGSFSMTFQAEEGKLKEQLLKFFEEM
ncbi:MAG: hypothetical protein JWQ35_1593 [Bacteriovoracaceae bacterium]|nr:hypothetical protein [Bacteriovoracaceae bacterium]